ncbi:unnamed protein product [Enterobius vermicularis]|uniref:Ground-like domain-containing protein n=1 Tax=Enterobius vermicularis TaxID=51028 RepID=A0A0N4VND2_ENTVE|nr:unnamed protein product [Enterobius vermicularis]
MNDDEEDFSENAISTNPVNPYACPCPPLFTPPCPPPTIPKLPPCLMMTTLPPCSTLYQRQKRGVRLISDSKKQLCNNQQIRKIILKNIGQSMSESKALIHAELKRVFGGNFVVICSNASISFIADSSTYCVDGGLSFHCYVFEA